MKVENLSSKAFECTLGDEISIYQNVILVCVGFKTSKRIWLI